MSEQRDHYRVLQVDPRAELLVIRVAYRALAARHHPDIGGDETEMVRLKRAKYDRELHPEQAADRWAAPTATPTAPAPAPRQGTGAVIDFGRYIGWSILEIARQDPNYLEWLVRTPNGRRYRAEIIRVLAILSGAAAPVAAAPVEQRRRWHRR